MSELEDLNMARQRLVEVLGDQSIRYFERMKQWFKMKITKEEFDLESRKQLTKEQIHLHNQFLLCLFQKCQGLAHTSRSKVIGSQLPVIPSAPTFIDSDCPSPSDSAKRLRLSKKRHHSERTGFEPVEVVDYLPTLRPTTYQPNDEPQRSCAHELFLPDQAFLMGRLMLAAWECGLDGANDSAADFLVVAVQHFLKSLLVAVISQRNSFKTNSKCFPYGMGTSIPNPWLRNAAHVSNPDGPTEILSLNDDIIDQNKSKRVEDLNDSVHLSRIRETSDEAEDREVLEAACSTQNGAKVIPPVSAWNLLTALQTHRSAVLSQTVYSINMERILTKLNHPSWDDEEAALARSGCVTSI